MSKISTVIFILSIILFTVCSTFYLLFDGLDIAFYSIVALIIFINLIVKKKQKDGFNKIILDYTIYCDIDNYINELKKYQKKFFQTKGIKAISSLYLARAYIDKGDFDNAIKYLMIVNEYEDKLNTTAILLYLKTWNDFYYYSFDIVKMSESLMKMKEIIDNVSNQRNLMQYIQLYGVQECKYYILSKSNLDKAKLYFEKRKKMIPQTGLPLLANNFQLGMISLIEKDYYSAYNIFKRIATIKLSKEIKENIYVIKKAKEYALKLKPYVGEENRI